MINTILLSFAAIILLINLILTIREALCYFPSAAHPGRIRGACVRAGGGKGSGWVEIDGMRYNVEWYLIGRKEEDESGK